MRRQVTLYGGAKEMRQLHIIQLSAQTRLMLFIGIQLKAPIAMSAHLPYSSAIRRLFHFHYILSAHKRLFAGRCQ